MTTRNLEFLFEPRSVALIGASGNERKLGHLVARNLLTGGFRGDVYLVNRKRDRVLDQPVFRSVDDLPVAPDLAVIATPPETLPDLVSELGRKGTRAAIVVTTRFGALGEEGTALKRQMLEASEPWLLRLLGPGSLGMAVPAIGLNASFGHLHPRVGELAFVTQSGAVVSSVVDWAQAKGIGFSHLVSLGGADDVDFGDMLDYLADQKKTRAILLYVETITHARKFMSAARAAARMKPVIVVKAGRYGAATRAFATGRGVPVDRDAVYDAAFRRAGLLRVSELDELFGATEILGRVQRVRGERLCIVTNGSGFGTMAVDELTEHRGVLARPSADTVEALQESVAVTTSSNNPVDLLGDADGARYGEALDVLLADPGIDATLVLHCPTAISAGEDVAQRLVSIWESRGRPALLTSFVGEASVALPRQICAGAGIPTFATPEDAVQGFMYLVDYRRNQRALMETPPSIPRRFTQDTGAAREIIGESLAAGQAWMSSTAARSLVEAYGVPVIQTAFAATPDEAGELAAGIDGPKVLKIVSGEIAHRSDVDGIVFDLDGQEEIREAARRMLRRVGHLSPGADIEGFLVEPMIRRRGATELLIAATVDPLFGPVMVFGQGGTAADTIADTAVGFPPLNMRLARDIMERTRVHRLLAGYRKERPADLDGVGTVLLQVSQLMCDFAEVVQVEINPLLADSDGVIAVDVRVRLAEASGPAVDRLAILPYPKSLEEEFEVTGGRRLMLRPIVPEDEPALLAAFDELTQEEIRLRFHTPLKVLTHMMAARFTQLDYDREMALVLTEPGDPGQTPIYGVVRLHTDPDHVHGDFAILVHHSMTGQGLGTHMMQRIIDYARQRGLKEIGGDVLNENRVMFGLAQKLGFRIKPNLEERGVKRIVLEL